MKVKVVLKLYKVEKNMDLALLSNQSFQKDIFCIHLTLHFIRCTELSVANNNQLFGS